MEQLPDFNNALPAVSVQPGQGVQTGAVNAQRQPGTSFRDTLALQKGLSENNLTQDAGKLVELQAQLIVPPTPLQPPIGTQLPAVLTGLLQSQLNGSPGSAADTGLPEGQKLPLPETAQVSVLNPGTEQSMPLPGPEISPSARMLQRLQSTTTATERGVANSAPVPEPELKPEPVVNRAQPAAQTVALSLSTLGPSTAGLPVQPQMMKLLAANTEQPLSPETDDTLSKLAQTLGVRPGADKQLRSDNGTPLSRVVEQVGLYSDVGDSRFRQADHALKPAESMVMKQDLDSPLWEREFANRIIWMTKNNMHTAKMRIDPPNLGSIEIKITVNHDQAAVSFLSNNAMVRDAIESASARLREVFAENGFQSLDVDVSGKDHQERQPRELAQQPKGTANASMQDDTQDALQDDTQDDTVPSPATGAGRSNLVVDYFV